VETLKQLGACGGAILWAQELPGDATAKRAWELCVRGDWQVWLLSRLLRLGAMPRETVTLALCAATRVDLPLLRGYGAEAPALRSVEAAERRFRDGMLAYDVGRAAKGAEDGAEECFSVGTKPSCNAGYAAKMAAACARCAVAFYDEIAANAAYDVSVFATDRNGIAAAVRAAVPWDVVDGALRRARRDLTYGTVGP
jgi:hypothetical protein